MQLLMCHYTTNGRLHVVGGRTSVRTPLSPDGQVSEMAGVWHLGDLSEGVSDEVLNALAARQASGMAEHGRGVAGEVVAAGCGIPSTSPRATTRRPGGRAARSRITFEWRAAPGPPRGRAMPGRRDAARARRGAESAGRPALMRLIFRVR